MDSDDAASVCSSSSNGSGFLPRILKRVNSNQSTDDKSESSTDSQLLPRALSQTRPPVSKDQDSNRILMPSPLPSPVSSNRKAVMKKPMMRHSDSDSQSESSSAQHEREEAHMKRLVHMAKQQQSLMTAWFAASSGRDVVDTSTALPPLERRRSSRARSRSSSRRGQGPVDVDTVNVVASGSVPQSVSRQSSGPIDVDTLSETDSSSSTCSGGSKKSFFRLVFPIAPSTPSTKSEGSATLKISNVTPDVESAIAVTDHKSARWTRRRRLIGGSLFCILILAVMTVVVCIIVSKRDDNRDNSSSLTSSAGTTFPPSPPSPESGDSSTTFPSQMPPSPTYLTPSAESLTWPSSPQPTAPRSNAPSVVPSYAPTTMPSKSPAPSMSPTESPTSIFSTTQFRTLITLSGQELLEQYGHTVAVSGDGFVVAIGAPNYSLETTKSAGSVQVFERFGPNQWRLRGQPLVGRNELDQFGYAVSLSYDGSRLAVSEPGFDTAAGDRAGNVRVFDHYEKDGAWILVGDEIGGEAVADLFGLSLALSGNGKRLVVGAPYHDGDSSNSDSTTTAAAALSGRVRVFEYAKSSWQPVGEALDGPSSLDWFGWSVAISYDGMAIAIGAPRNTDHGGFVRGFQWTSKKKDGGDWTQIGSDIVNNIGNSVEIDDRFGMALALSLDGKRLAVGSPWKDADSRVRRSGLVVVYQRSNEDNDWVQMGDALVGNNVNGRLGWSLDLSGDYLAIGIPGMNQVSFHQWTGTTWDTATISQSLQGDQQMDGFGHAVAISSEGNVLLVVGAPESSSSSSGGGVGYARVLQQQNV